VRLDDVLEADGVLDRIRFSDKTDAGVELAASMLLSINVSGEAVAVHDSYRRRRSNTAPNKAQPVSAKR